MSPFDSVSFLRVAIQADIMKAAISNNAGHRHGHRGYHGCPPFAFSYADGVAIDRGQEERLSVKDIAIQSSAPPCTVTDDPEREVGIESGSVLKEMNVFLRAGEPRTKQATTDDGAGVLHRWESLQRGSCGGEVREQLAKPVFERRERPRCCRRRDVFQGSVFPSGLYEQLCLTNRNIFA